MAYTSTGLDVAFELTASNTYQLTAGTNIVSGTLAAGSALSQVVFSNNSAGPNTERDFYLGAMSVTELLNSSGTVTTNAPAVTRTSGDVIDGIPNDWWDDFFANPADWVAGDDADRDGFTNGEEHDLGTDPSSASSRFAVESLGHDGTAMVVTWDSVPGKTYRLQARPSLTEGSWVDVGAEITATSATTSTIHNATQAHFYRGRLVP
jgi:hypothetical protein